MSCLIRYEIQPRILRQLNLFTRGPGVVIASGVGADLIKRIQNTRRELLDLSARNRLISTPRASSPGKKIEIVDERSEEVFRLLVREFLHGIEKGISPAPNFADALEALLLADARSTGSDPTTTHTDGYNHERISGLLHLRAVFHYYTSPPRAKYSV